MINIPSLPENHYKLNWLKNNKYYSIYIQPNLFGGTSVIKVWGSSTSKRSGHKIIFCASETDISKIITETAKRRKSRHYVEANLT